MYIHIVCIHLVRAVGMCRLRLYYNIDYIIVVTKTSGDGPFRGFPFAPAALQYSIYYILQTGARRDRQVYIIYTF